MESKGKATLDATYRLDKRNVKPKLKQTNKN